MEEKARLAFTRVLDRDPTNANALTLLSILEFNKSRAAATPFSDKERLRKSSMGMLAKAHKSDARNPIVATQMAERCMQSKKYDKVMSL
jgi:cytochrome c-type biogenesis protein CcmH/NrfG